MEELELMDSQVMNADFWQLLIRFVFNTFVNNLLISYI